MDYKVVITLDAEADLDQFVWYLLYEKKSEQAAKNLLDDFEMTKKRLERVVVKVHRTIICSSLQIRDKYLKTIRQLEQGEMEHLEQQKDLVVFQLHKIQLRLCRL